MKQHTDQWWRKFATFEMAAATLVTAFAAGGIWFSLNSQIANAADNSEANTQKLAVVQGDINEIKTDVALIKQDSVNRKEADSRMEKELTEQRADIKSILKLLEARAARHNGHIFNGHTANGGG